MPCVVRMGLVVLPFGDLSSLVGDESGLFVGFSGKEILLVAPGFLPLFDSDDVSCVKVCPGENIDVVREFFSIRNDPLDSPRCRFIQPLEKDQCLTERLTSLVFRDDSVVTSIALGRLEDLGFRGDALRIAGRVWDFARPVGFGRRYRENASGRKKSVHILFKI